LSRPLDFTFRELTTLLGQLGYELDNKGRTSGSRVCYRQEKTGHVIFLHRPHPATFLKRYQVDYVIEMLQKTGAV